MNLRNLFVLVLFFGSNFNMCFGTEILQNETVDRSCSLEAEKNISSFPNSLIQSILVSLYSIPLIRTTVFTNSLHLIDESGHLRAPKSIMDQMYLGLVGYFLYLEKQTGDQYPQIEQFFNTSLFSVKTAERTLGAIIGSSPEPVKEIFMMALSNSTSGSKSVFKKLFHQIKITGTPNENILEVFQRSGYFFVATSKIIMLPINRYFFSGSNVLYRIVPCLIYENIRIETKIYKLAAKVGQVHFSEYSSFFGTSHIKSDGKIITTVHLKDRDNMQIISHSGFESIDRDSSLLIYVAEDEDLMHTLPVDYMEKLHAAFDSFKLDESKQLPAFALKKTIKIGELVEYFKSTNISADDVKFMVNSDILSHTVTASMLPRLNQLDEYELRLLCFTSSTRIELEGGQNYSFEKRERNESYVAVELMLAMLESNKTILKHIFRRAAEATCDICNNHLALVLLQMLMGRRDISIRELVHEIIARVKISPAELAAAYSNDLMISHQIRKLLLLFDPRLLILAPTKVIKYSGIDSEDVISIDLHLSQVPVPAAFTIASGTVEIEGAWLDIKKPNDPDRYRHIYRASESELFAVMINRSFSFTESIANSRGSRPYPVKFYGKGINIHSMIVQHPISKDFLYIKLDKGMSGIYFFKPGSSNFKYPFSDLEYRSLLENYSIMVFFENIKESNETPLYTGHIPKNVYSIVYTDIVRKFRGRKRACSENENDEK